MVLPNWADNSQDSLAGVALVLLAGVLAGRARKNGILANPTTSDNFQAQ
ncbi:MAG: hypothetical protein AAF394_06250 [Planctomycetota bacterium]